MPMDRNELLNAVIDDGIEECRHTYLRPDQRDKLQGALEGFEACRGKSDEELLETLQRYDALVRAKMEQRAGDYWRHRMAMLQVEWTLNVLSAAAHAHGRPTAVTPTARGMMKAAQILGVAGNSDAGQGV